MDFAFYDVDEKYIQFLKKLDKQVPDVKYDSNNKFVCGIVLDINGVPYYAPVSHMVKKQRTNLLICDRQGPIASIRFSFMFPAPGYVLTKKNFAQIATIDVKYADLLKTEFMFCKKHIADIKRKALDVYKIGCNKNHVLNYTCCDFLKLENNYLNFDNENKLEKFPVGVYRQGYFYV